MILNERLCPLIIKSKSVYHAVTTINNEFDTNFKLKTIYWQIKNNFLPIKSSDLPRSNRKAKSKDKDTNYKRDIKNHTFEDYKNYKKANPNAIETQMDTVEGIKENNAPVLLTLEIVDINFLFIFKIENKTIDKVKEKLTYFKDIIGKDSYNYDGTEFYNGLRVELLADCNKEYNGQMLVVKGMGTPSGIQLKHYRGRRRTSWIGFGQNYVNLEVSGQQDQRKYL